MGIRTAYGSEPFAARFACAWVQRTPNPGVLALVYYN